ncbi:MAG TPA: 30S ribosomal protein S8 [Candidatus Brocadiia bacterium]|nr:30S ribosomal protein S8 [Candidatus Brocadiia bacterium]
MTMTDPIADMLTRMRNAIDVRKRSVDMPGSKMKERIAQALAEEGFIESWSVGADPKGRKTLRVYLKYGPLGQSVIQVVKRESRPGRRFYLGNEKMPPVLNGLGVRIISTSKGVMSDRRCRELKIGGEVLCTVY